MPAHRDRGHLREDDGDGSIAADEDAGSERIDEGRDVGAEDVGDDVLAAYIATQGEGDEHGQGDGHAEGGERHDHAHQEHEGAAVEDIEAAADTLGLALELGEGAFEDGEREQEHGRPHDEHEQARQDRIEGIGNGAEGGLGALEEGLRCGRLDPVEPAQVECEKAERDRRPLGREGDEHGDDADGDAIAAAAPKAEGDEAGGEHDEGGAET